jgi:sirohydrochlorin cobaltochelatase
MKCGFVLFAHGARDARWAQPFEAVAARARAARPDVQWCLAYLEFMAPTMADAVAELVAGGCERVAVLPLFLGTGGHVRRDLPIMLEALRTEHPGVQFALHAAVGEFDAVAAAMAGVALALLDSTP